MKTLALIAVFLFGLCTSALLAILVFGNGRIYHAWALLIFIALLVGALTWNEELRR